MREFIQIQVGNCGNQIGTKFWEEITEEHGVDTTGIYKGTSPLQLEHINTYFNEGTSSNHYVPRAILIDLEPNTLDNIKGGKLGKLFNPDNIISYNKATQGSWAKGYYTQGQAIINSLEDTIRKEAEKCDGLQGFQVCHSLGGGTGSGLATLIVAKLREVFVEERVCTYSVLPSLKNPYTLEPYNIVLAMHHLIENADEVFLFDNDALRNICSQMIPTSTFGDLNNVVSKVMSGITSCIRFPGQEVVDFCKLQVNLCLYPRLKFFSIGCAPNPLDNKQQLTISQLTQRIFEPNNQLIDYDPNQGKYLAAAAIYRGKTSNKQVEDELYKIKQSHSSQFAEWMPHQIKSVVCELPPNTTQMSATLISSNTNIRMRFKRVRTLFNEMVTYHAFEHYYTDDIDSMELSEAESNVCDLEAEYEQYEFLKDEEEDEDVD